MKRILEIMVIASAILLLPPLVSAQEDVALIGERIARKSVRGSGGSTAEQIKLLRERKSVLEQRLATSSRTAVDYWLVADWIRELDEKIEELTPERTATSSRTRELETQTVWAANIEAQLFPVSKPGLGSMAPQTRTQPDFRLSRPVGGATNEEVTPKLGWSEDKQSVKTYTLTKFIVEVATGDNKQGNGRFSHPIFVREVAPSGVRGQDIDLPKDTLKSGQEYFWQVLAEFVPQGSTQPELKAAANAPESFKTVAKTFDAFESRGLTLQRAVSGDDATEGAQFGFLKTFNKQTVYTADFALIYNKRFKTTQRTAAALQASWQGSLTSDESDSEDALQFRVGMIIDRNLKRNTINHLYSSLAAKYETDQKFTVAKLISENMVTPTFPVVGIGIPFGRPSDPIQFRWRPYFYFDIGRTFKKGDSTETQDTVWRLTPRVRTTVTLNFLRRALNLNDTFIFADDYLYFLPLEKTKSRHNMFTSGFVLQVTQDFGFGLTYKSGEAAPKFKPVHTFGGVLTIRFGKE